MTFRGTDRHLRKGSHWIFLLLMLAGCAGTPRQAMPPPHPIERRGSVEESTIESTAAESYPVELGVSYESPVILGDYPLPDYPADQVALGLPPVTVDVRVIVSSDGRVERVESLVAPDETSRPFHQATSEALLRWEFSPLRRVENGFATEVPFHQKYRFVFTQTDGKARRRLAALMPAWPRPIMSFDVFLQCSSDIAVPRQAFRATRVEIRGHDARK